MNYREKHWNQKYLDALDQIYWAPKYIGLKSIRRNAEERDGKICISKDVLNHPSASIFTRDIKAKDYTHWLTTQEEILNHVFDITFAIAPDELIDLCFFQPLQLKAIGEIESLGRETNLRYGYEPQTNLTAVDGMFVAENAIAMVELKLGAPSNIEQILKYLFLALHETALEDADKNVGLLYILPQSKLDGFRNKLCAEFETLRESPSTWRLHFHHQSKVVRVLEENQDRLFALIDALSLKFMSWETLIDVMEAYAAMQNDRTASGQTLVRLIAGFTAQVKLHLANFS